MKEKEILDVLRHLLKKSYSSYSKFRVAAVLKTKSGNFYKGCNIEHASYGLPLCAERVNATNAVTQGEKKFKQLILKTDSAKTEFPCGADLQFLAEFNPDLKITTYSRNGRKKQQTFARS